MAGNGVVKQGGFLDGFLATFRRTRVAPTKTEGVGGTAVFGGFVDDNEVSSDLRGITRYKTYSDMLANVSIVAAGVRYFLGLIGKAGWKFEPADESSQAEELAENVDTILRDMTTPWHRVVRRAAMFRFWGYSIQEWTAVRREDGMIGFVDVEPRPQLTIERWDLDESGTVFGVMQRSPQTQEEIYLPRSKLVYIVDDALNDSPEGMGLFRQIIDSARRLQRYEQLEGWGYETDLRGIPVGRAPLAELERQRVAGTIDAAEKTRQIQALSTFLEKHIKTPQLSLLLDSRSYETEDERSAPSAVRQWDVELLQSSSTAHEAVLRAIERLNREIARVLGVETLLLGERGAGSLALARDKTQQFALLVDGTLTELKESFDSDLLDPLFNLNGWPEELKPTIKIEAVQYRDVNDITEALRNVSTAFGPLPGDSEAMLEIFDLLGLSRPNVEDIMRDAALAERAQAEAMAAMNEDDEDVEEVNPVDEEDEE